MTITKALSTVFLSILLLGFLGGFIGSSLGRIHPSYYRTVFRVSPEDTFDAVSVGLGLGITQGMVGGAVVGLALVAVLSWWDTRKTNNRSDVTGPISRSDVGPRTKYHKARLVLFMSCGLLALVACSFIGFVVGGLMGEDDAYRRRFLEERDAISPVLESDTTFTQIEIVERSDGGIWLEGQLVNDDHLRLTELVQEKLGESRGREAMEPVWVSDQGDE